METVSAWPWVASLVAGVVVAAASVWVGMVIVRDAAAENGYNQRRMRSGVRLQVIGGLACLALLIVAMVVLLPIDWAQLRQH